MSTPAERSLHASMAAHVLHSRVDPKQHTAPARRAFLDRFAKQVIAEAAERGEELSDAEVIRRSEHAKTAYMKNLSLKSAQARRERAA